MLQTFGNHAERERLDASDGFIAILPVRQDPGQGRHFGEPASIILSLNFDCERHAGNVPSGPLSNKATADQPRVGTHGSSVHPGPWRATSTSMR